MKLLKSDFPGISVKKERAPDGQELFTTNYKPRWEDNYYEVSQIKIFNDPIQIYKIFYKIYRFYRIFVIVILNPMQNIDIQL